MGLFDLFKKKNKDEKSKKYELGMKKTRQGLMGKLKAILSGYSEINEDLFDDLTDAFIMADIGVETTLDFIEALKEDERVQGIHSAEELQPIIIDKMFELYLKGDIVNNNFNLKKDGLSVFLFVGVNGVGKTTTTANLGSALALEGKKVVLVDTDIGLRNLDVVMGLENRIVYDIVDVVEEKCKLRQALIKDKRFQELFLLPAAQTRDKSAITEEQMRDLTKQLKEEFDYILIDCPAGIEQGFKNAIVGADKAIVVTMPEISAIRDADRIIGLLESSDIKNPQLIINKLRPEMVRKGKMMDVDDIVDLLSIELLGVVPDDEYVITQTNKGEPVISNRKAPSGKAYMETAKRILGEDIEVTIPGREKGFLAALKRFFKRK